MVWSMAHWLLVLTLMMPAWALEAQGGLVDPPSCPPAESVPCTVALNDERFNERINKYKYIVDGMHLQIQYIDGDYFGLKCLENLQLDNEAMPAFMAQLVVGKAMLADCPAPRGSYGAVLQRLNVYVKDMLRLTDAGNLTGSHLAELGDVHTLELVNVELAPRTLAAPAGLRALLLDNVRLPPDELRQLPRSLESLELTRMGTDVPRDVLERLPKLDKITVRDSGNVSVALGGALRVLTLEMPAAHVPSALSPALSSLAVSGWDERWPAPWTACALETLKLFDIKAEELPAHWLSDCVQLRVLRVHYGPQLRALHATSLRGARHLQELQLTSCALEALPGGLLDDAVELRELDLSRNFLKELTSGLFAQTRSLQMLRLSRNRLTTDVYTSLKAVTSLHELRLDHNDLIDSSLALNLSIPLITI